ncbi:hypothetical protein CF165_14025 [Amycolatopsis vastitatis]|uniref:Uncharacterized protein n=1 Tax=Amycolatopsis vastitatis TaxID=1905142 RepID=A0A229TAH1_9PSEU|nr:hypothetical protein CF165_14025 [Amycolatopsis vastitatis]
MLGVVKHGQLPRGGKPAVALDEIEAGIEAAWQAFQAGFDVVAGSSDETSLAEAVLLDPSEFEWRVVDGALNRLTCQDCHSTLGAGPVGCHRCDQANGYRFAAKEIDRPHVPPGNEHALRVASAVARTRHRYSPQARCGYELALPSLLDGDLPTTAEAQASKAAINKLTDAELDSVTSLSDVVARSTTATG